MKRVVAWLDGVPGVKAALGELLGSTHGALLAPIRSEIFGAQRFAQHGRSLGQTHRAARLAVGAPTFFPRLQDNIRSLRQAHAYIGALASTGYDISPAAEWLLDNFHLIQAQLQEIHEGLPRSYFRSLPVLLDPPLAGLPRVYGVAWAFVAHTDGVFDEELLVHYLDAYQETRELRLSEMWAIPTTLRVVLVENLRRLAERVATNKAARELANLCCDHLPTLTIQRLDELLSALQRRGVANVFLLQMALRLQAQQTAGDADTPDPYLAWVNAALPDLSTLLTQQDADQAADNLSVSNAVTSLRAIGEADWNDVVARSSHLVRLMLESPVFAAEHTQTRDQSLHAIEALARRAALSETAVAQALLGLMRASAANDPAEQVPIHWLLGRGRSALLHALGQPARPAWLARWTPARLALPLYLASVGLASLAGVAWLLPVLAPLAPVSMLARLGLTLLVLLPVSQAVVAVINRLICESAKPQLLARLALRAGIPPEQRVLVVIPAVLSSVPVIGALCHQLELHYLANPEPHAQFALLSDWADAAEPTHPSDQSLLDQAVTDVTALNLRYPQAAGVDGRPGPARFVLLHRARRYCATQQCWMGWERKRGKLEQLVAALAVGERGAFVDLGALSALAIATPYVLTLDSDTQLPPGRLRDLVGVAAHPHNVPQLDASARRVRRGYGIVQPHVATPLPSDLERTRFHWLFAGQCGIDPYSAASSEVYQDVFGEGSFTGKGLLHVQTLHTVLAGRLPRDQVLSHDLLEGSMVRCAALSDLAVLESAPFHADVAAARVHRWTRGDWQLLPLLLQPARYPLRAINRWKLWDNLRRSLVAPASCVLLLLALAGELTSPGWVLGLLLAAFGAGPLLGALAGLSSRREHLARHYFYRQAGLDLLRTAAAAAWQVALLPQQAAMALDAIVRALYRSAISKRQLLQWTTAAAAQAAAKSRLSALWWQHRWSTVAALLVWVCLLRVDTPTPALASALCLLWALAPVLTWWVSLPAKPGSGSTLTPTERDYLHAVARDTWRYFEKCVGPDDNHLPPDNLQTLPSDMLAHRTSPTNIGLYLLSVACAREFGWIDSADMLTRLEATLASLRKLKRYRGHFLNWYDSQTLAPLLPMYVSTVDSGNLSGHLLASAQACRELARQPDQAAVAAQLLRLSADLERLAWEPEFGFLYHRKRRLLHIGFRVAEQQLDAAFYDLLASESRLTSLLAIAKGDVPAQHWAALGRPLYAVGPRAGLRSWSGSMFEYLMPGLTLREPPGSVLASACATALVEQKNYAHAQGVPWGISESAYAGRDQSLAYQYAPQGVPRLALRRTPPLELVVAPYATALAAPWAPRAALRNLIALQRLGARNHYGFMEALDFTPQRRLGDEPLTLVSTFMAHHQGMSIVALANVLLDGVAQRWGMANASIEAVASLLHERVPRELSLLSAPAPGLPPAALLRRAPSLLREVTPGAAALEPTHVLSNGRYSVTLRANGAGWSRWGPVGVSRWRDDALRDAYGQFFYLRGLGSASSAPLVSLTQHPAPDARAHYQSSYHADRVCLNAAWPHVHSQITVLVSPEDDIELRTVSLHNRGTVSLELELISAFEVTLSAARADEAHPAFANLFVKAAWWPEHQALVFERTPRLSGEAPVQMAHFLAQCEAQVLGVRVQTDRQLWLGRNRTAAQPLASLGPNLHPAAALTPQPLVTGLDPVCVLAVRLRLPAGTSARLSFATTVSDHAATLAAVLDKYQQRSTVQRASLMSATLTGIRLRGLNMSADNFAAIQLLTSALELTLTRPKLGAVALTAAPPETVLGSRRSALWRFGLSGERPIILVTVGVAQSLSLLRALAQALRLWSWGNIACDLVVVNTQPTSYDMALQRELAGLRDRHAADSGAATGHAGLASTGFYLLRADELSPEELRSVHSLARIRLLADGRPLWHHVRDWSDAHDRALDQRQGLSVVPWGVAQPASGDARPDGAAPVPLGEFVGPQGTFAFAVTRQQGPTRPWVNVLSNEHFGTQVSEAGSGFTWALNSRLNPLTTWSNDPVADPPSEWLCVQDLKTRAVWSLCAGPLAAPGVVYQVQHEPGRSSISHRQHELELKVTWCVDAQLSVKQIHVHVLNRSTRTRYLRVLLMAEWLMGQQRSDRSTLHTQRVCQRLVQHKLSVLLATQQEHTPGLGKGTAFLALAAANNDMDDWSCDRREFFDTRGVMVLPDHLGQRAGVGLDPCAALATRQVLGSGESAHCTFLLGYADSADAATQLATVAATSSAVQRETQAVANWEPLLSAATVHTPDPLFDVLVNRWLLYQTVACRLWAKAGFYQAGGATGFRDQLQDAMALAWAQPECLRAQILRCAARQYEPGDVQHWWHEPGGAGVRTHFSDDLLWLPYALVHYLRASGDVAVLDQSVPFLEGAEIPEGAEDVYDTPAVSTRQASLFEHAARALDISLEVGCHGLPLMGAGDWNDGMNRVGHLGRGESVWLGWFLCALVTDMAPLASARGEWARALRWETAARAWRKALEAQAWDGQWFKRAFFDDGSALGSHTNPEAQIDLVAQAWAVLSRATSADKQRQAMAAVQRELVDGEHGLIQLLRPPLALAQPSAGYIQAYPPGVRENGGQYSHAGVWALMAQAKLAQGLPADDAARDLPYRYFTYLSPAHRAAHPQYGAAYGLEPYVVAGDVYSQPPYVGRGGWSWYTGAAAWLHRAAIESIFGLHMASSDVLSLTPCVPRDWPLAELRLRRGQQSLRFVLVRAMPSTALEAARLLSDVGAAQLLMPGQTLAWTALPAATQWVLPLLAQK